MPSTLLIAGIGNPGNSYKSTWHNAGIDFLDFYAGKLIDRAIAPVVSRQIKGEDIQCYRLTNKDRKVEDVDSDAGDAHRGTPWEILLYKSTHFMNDSGKGVSQIMKFLKLPPNRLVLCYDDLDIELGKSKLQFGRHPKAHNGVLSVIAALGTEGFHHLRLGIYTQQVEVFNSGRDYVLSNMPAEKREVLYGGFTHAADKLSSLLM